jgi:hypothetical protein
MKYLRILSAPSAVLLASLCVPGAFAAVLTPGNSGAPTDMTASLAAGVLVASTGHVAATQTSATLTGDSIAGVWQENGTGFLDFLYQFRPDSGDAVNSITGQNFFAGLGSISTGYLTNAGQVGGSFQTPSGTNATPSGSSWNPTSVQFSFTNAGVNPNYTDILVIHTTATTWSAGVALFQGTGQASAPAFQPTPEPAQAGLLLGGIFAAGLFVARKFRVQRS